MPLCCLCLSAWGCNQLENVRAGEAALLAMRRRLVVCDLARQSVCARKWGSSLARCDYERSMRSICYVQSVVGCMRAGLCFQEPKIKCIEIGLVEPARSVPVGFPIIPVLKGIGRAVRAWMGRDPIMPDDRDFC